MPFQEDLNTNVLEEWRVGDQIDIKDGYEAVFRKLVAYGSGKATVDAATLVFTGTGNGLLHDLDLGVDAPTETWTIDATSATNFTVTGTVSGAQLDATVGEPYTTSDVRGTATSGDIDTLTDSGATFETDGVAPGHRIVNKTQGEEVFVLVVSSETSLETTALASGSWNGDDYSINNPYTSLINFKIVAGGTAFVSGDDWVMDVTVGENSGASVDQWILDRWDPFADFKAGPAEKNGYLHWHGEGDGTEEIYTGIRLTETPASSIFNFVQRGFTGFSEASDWDAQPGSSDEIFTALREIDLRYWIVHNSRRYAMSVFVSGTYHSLYNGFFLAYGSPEEYPYPLCIVGNRDEEQSYTSTNGSFSSIVVTSNNHFVRDVAGLWLTGAAGETTTSAQKWPNSSQQGTPFQLWSQLQNHENGDHQLFPVVFTTGDINAGDPDLNLSTALGELEGIRNITGFTQSSEDVIAIAGTDHIVFENIFRIGVFDFWAMEMA